MNKIEIDGDLYDQFAAEGRLMPGMVRGLSDKERKAKRAQERADLRRHFDYLRTQQESVKPVKRDKSGLKARLRELQRAAALGR